MSKWNRNSRTFPPRCRGVGLAERLGLFGERTDQEVDPAEIAVAQPGQPRSDLWLDFDGV
ncbi:MAG: hypothetical protein ABR922_15220 [Streptosporangiaceae bacterium]